MRGVEHARAGEHDVLAHVLGHRAFQPRDPGDAVRPVGPVGQQLPPVAEHDGQTGVPVEGTAGDQAQHRDGGLHVPAPPERRERQVGGGAEPGVRRVAHGGRRDLRVHEHRQRTRRGDGEQVVEARVVEQELAAAAVDHRPDHAQVGGAFQLGRDRRRRRGGQGRHRPQASRTVGDGRGGGVVELAAQRDRVRRVQRPGRGRGDREHLQVDALGVHRGDPARAEVVQLREVVADVVQRGARVPPVRRQGGQRRVQRGGGPVLLDGDDRHGCSRGCRRTGLATTGPTTMLPPQGRRGRSARCRRAGGSTIVMQAPPQPRRIRGIACRTAARSVRTSTAPAAVSSSTPAPPVRTA